MTQIATVTSVSVVDAVRLQRHGVRSRSHRVRVISRRHRQPVLWSLLLKGEEAGLQIDPSPIWVVKCDSDHSGDSRLSRFEGRHRQQDLSLMQ